MTLAVPTPEVEVPSSVEEAVTLFGEGSDVTVVAGGTIVMPDIVHGRRYPGRTLLLHRAGMGGVRSDGGRTVVGAMTPIVELEGLADPLGAAARYVADREIRAQATLGGNLCASPGADSPRGDLQAALIALGAEVRSVGAGGERTDAVEDVLGEGLSDRLVLDVAWEDPEAGAHSSVRRPHAHAYTVLAVCVARTSDGVRVAASGAAPHGIRLHGVEAALADGADAETAAERALEGAELQTDALASAWYREKTLPVLVRRALTHLS